MIKRVITTIEAEKLIDLLKVEHGDLMFHQSGGCCDGSAPMCFQKGEFLTGEGDVLLGKIVDCEFYIGRQQFEYWKHTQLIIDVIEGRGGMFSLEGPTGKRFLTRSRLFTEEENAELQNSPV